MRATGEGRNTEPLGRRISKSAARELIVTSVLALTDQHPGSLDIEVVGALPGIRSICILLALPSEARRALRRSSIALGWDDVALLAAAHDVICTRDGAASTLRFSVISSRA
jgi:hypothetical protein